MSLIKAFIRSIKDPVRQVQLFMLSRHTGVVLASIVLARYLPQEEVGIFEMLMLSGYLMTFFWSDALLKGYLAKISGENGAESASSFVWLYLLAGLLSMSLLVFGQKLLLPLIVDRPSLKGLQLFALYQALIIPVWIAPFLGLLKGQKPLILSVYVLAGPVFACWVGLKSFPGLFGVLIGLVSYAVVGLAWVLTSTSFVRDLRLKNMLVKLWPATWPLVMYALSTGLARSFDAWLVARHFDESTFAAFRYGAREFPLVMAFAAGLSTIMIPKLQSAGAVDELRVRSTRLMHFCFPLVAVLMVFSPVLFSFFFGKAYTGSALIFNIYLLLTLTQLIFPQSILTARGDTRQLWYISIAELVVNVVASLILLSYFGLAGIAWGTLIAFVFEKVALILILRERYSIRPAKLINPLVWGGYALLLALSFITAKWIFGI